MIRHLVRVRARRSHGSDPREFRVAGPLFQSPIDTCDTKHVYTFYLAGGRIEKVQRQLVRGYECAAATCSPQQHREQDTLIY